MSTAVDGALVREMTDEGTATTRYRDCVPIATKFSDSEDVVQERIVQVLLGSSPQDRDLKILKIYISNDDECSFLHTYEVTEGEFQTLKAEQGIVVDFGNFPGKIICLLKKCVECREQETPRYQAVHTVLSGESKLQIIETNDFNKLAHITLSFRPCRDEDVKQFLAARLAEIKAHCQLLEKELKNAKKQNGAAQGELISRQQNSVDSQVSCQQEPAANEKIIVVRGQEERMSTSLAGINGGNSDVEKRLRDDLETLKACNELTTKENRELRLCKQEQQIQISDLECRVTALEGQKAKLEEECIKLREQSHNLQNETQDLELRVNEEKVSSRGLEDQVAQSRSQIKTLESKCEELQQSLAKAKEDAKKIELEKRQSDQIIEKFAMELQGSREKTKKKQAHLLRREEQVGQLQGEIDALKAQKELFQSDYEKMRTEALHLESTNKELLAELRRYQERPLEGGRMGMWPNQQVVHSTSQRAFPPPPLGPSNTYHHPQQMAHPWYPQHPSPSRDSGSRDIASRYNRLRG